MREFRRKIFLSVSASVANRHGNRLGTSRMEIPLAVLMDYHLYITVDATIELQMEYLFSREPKALAQTAIDWHR